MRFTADVTGVITGLRFYKGPANGGVHVANLWTATGTKLATATFSIETAIGWQEVVFPTPVDVSAGLTYVACVPARWGLRANSRLLHSGVPQRTAPRAG